MMLTEVMVGEDNSFKDRSVGRPSKESSFCYHKTFQFQSYVVVIPRGHTHRMDRRNILVSLDIPLQDPSPVLIAQILSYCSYITYSNIPFVHPWKLPQLRKTRDGKHMRLG